MAMECEVMFYGQLIEVGVSFKSERFRESILVKGDRASCHS
jgi:hypothetical protein